MLLALFCAWSVSASGQTYTWAVGDGTWDTTSSNWSGSGAVWGDGSNAVFANTSSLTAITLSSGLTAGSVSVGNGGNNANYTFSDSSLSAASFAVQGNGGNEIPSNGTTTFNNAQITLSGDLGVGRANLVIGGASTVVASRIGGGGMTGISSPDWGQITIQDNADVTATNGVQSNAEAWGLYLNGGTLTTSGISYAPHQSQGQTNLVFNGTQIKANQNNANFVTYSGSDFNFSPNVQSGGALVDTNGFNIGIRMGFGGSGGLTKSGAGTLELTAENSYSGGTTVNAGTLLLPSNGGAGRIRGTLTVNAGATVETTGDGTGLGYIDQISSVAINQGTVTSAGTSHIWNIAGGITMTGGTLQSNGGVSDPTGAHLEWNRTDVVTNASANTATIGGRIRIRGDNGYSGIALNVADGAAATDLLVSAAITEATGGMGVTKSGAGTMVLSGNNSYSGATTVSQGVVSLVGSSALPASRPVVIAAGATLSNDAPAGTSFNLGALTMTGGELAATAAPDSGLGNYHLKGNVTVSGTSMSTISADVRVIQNDDRTFNVADVDGGTGVDLLVSGVIGHWSGNSWGYVTKTGAGTMKISGSNGLGGITVNEGTLVLEGQGINSLQVNGLVNNANSEISVATGTASASFRISGSGVLTKSGAGALVLDTNNQSSGGLVVNGGTVIANRSPQDNGGDSSLGDGPVTVNNGGTLRSTQNWTTGTPFGNPRAVAAITINNGGTWSIEAVGQMVKNGLSVSGGSITGDGANADWGLLNLSSNLTAGGNATSTVSVDTALNGGRTIVVDTGSQLNYSGVIHDQIGTSGAITKSGAGRLVLSANNTYSGVSVFEAGILDAATFADNGTASSLGVGTGDADGNSIGLLFRGGTLQYTGATAQSTNRAIRLSTTGGGGTIDASGSEPSATLTFSAAASPNFFENPGNRTLTLTGSNTGTNTFAMAIGQADGTTSVVKNGVGRWVLTGTSDYTGDTDVNAGTLVVNGSLGATPVSVASAATLGGSGTIGGPVSILPGGILAPGNSPGTLTINSTLTLEGASLLNFEINAADTTVGGGINDLITGVTNLALGGTLNLSGTGDFTAATQGTSWRLIDYSGTLTDNTLTIGSAPTLAAGLSFTVDTSTANQVNLAVVPEPGTLGLAALGLAAAGWLACRRRR